MREKLELTVQKIAVGVGDAKQIEGEFEKSDQIAFRPSQIEFQIIGKSIG